MSTQLRWGILSTARINRRVLPAIRAADRSTVWGVASRSLQSARAFADRWDIPHVFESYDALLDSPEVDAVYIPLPNSLHHRWAVRAARAGKHILCAKPLALSVAEVDEMAQAARENGVVLLEAFQYHMHPQLATLKSLLADGLIGALKIVRAHFSFPLSDARNIRLQKSLGGGSLWDVGCYPVSFTQAVVGAPPVEVFGWQRTNAAGVEIRFAGQLRFAGDVVAQIDCGFELPFRMGAEVIGEAGVLRVPIPWIPDVDNRGSGLIHIAADDTETRIPTPVKNPYLCEVETLERAALDGVPSPYTLTHSRNNVATIVALYQSAQRGEVVRVSSAD